MAEDKPQRIVMPPLADQGYRIIHRPPQELLRAAWDAMVAHGFVATVFYDGAVTTWEQFLTFAYAEWNHLYGLMFEGKIEGLAWLNCFEGRTCRGHFTGIPGGLARAKNHGINFATWAMNAHHPVQPGKYWLNAIVGVTPANNRVALRFIKKIGFRLLATIPQALVPAGQDEPVDMVLSIMTRKTISEVL